jgi:uncharacterized damage-inducible protein DinB
MTDPLIQAAADLLDTALRDMREAIAGAPAERLNDRPAGDGTNSIAVLTVHALHATRWWLSVALGVLRPDRHRPSEFLATTEGASDLLATFDEIAADCRALLDAETPFDAAAMRDPSGYDENEPKEEPVTAGWALLHALTHLQEHTAQLQLTRQLFLANAAP